MSSLKFKNRKHAPDDGGAELQDFVEELRGLDLSEKTAESRTTRRAEQLGISADDASKIFEKHYRRTAEAPPKAPSTLNLKNKVAKKKTATNDTPLLFRWRDAWVAVEDRTVKTGLCSTTRLVLWTVSKYMKPDGTNAFPSQERIAKDSALTLRAVKNHLTYAIDLGWLSRKKHPTQHGKGFRYEYAATFPSESSS